MNETRYINKDWTCNYSSITKDDGSSLSIMSDGNIPSNVLCVQETQ